jgi:hypothetical protein
VTCLASSPPTSLQPSGEEGRSRTRGERRWREEEKGGERRKRTEWGLREEVELIYWTFNM